MSVQVFQPFEIFYDINGKPVDDGFIFIGQFNLDPEANPISVFFDEALTIPATQPIRTRNGFPANAGAQARVFVAGTEFSLTIKNKNSTVIRSDFRVMARERVSVESFGPATSASIQQAVNYLATRGGGVLEFNSPSYTMTSAVDLPVNLSGELILEGKGARLVVQAGARCFDVGRLADYDTLRNVVARDFLVDATAMTGRNHVFLGTYEGGTHLQRLNFHNLQFSNIQISGPAIDPTLTIHPVAFFITSTHPGSAEATQNTIRDLVFEDVHITGCNAGFLVAGLDLSAGTNANVFIDGVTIRNCSHVESAPPPSFFSSSHIQIGQDATCDHLVIQNFKGVNSGDNSIELNNCRSASVINATADGCFNLTYYVRNYNNTFDPTDQLVVYKNCKSNVTGDRAHVLGWAAGSANLGRIVIDDCEVTFPDSNDTTQAGYAVFAGVSATVPFDSLLVKGLKTRRAVDHTLSASVFPAAISVRPAARSNVTIRDWKADVTGTVTPGAFQYNHRLINAFGTDLILDVDKVDFNYNVTNSTAIRGISTGENVGDSVSGAVSRFIINSNVSCQALILAGSAVLDREHAWVFNDCDFSGAVAAAPISYGTTAMRDFVRLRNVLPLATPASSTIAPTGSPFDFKNNVGYPVFVTVSGGTVSDIALAPETAFTSTGLISGGFYLENGHTIRVTYTVAPTMRNIPQWQT